MVSNRLFGLSLAETFDKAVLFPQGMKAKHLICLLVCTATSPLCAQQVNYSFAEARDRMERHNAALKVAGAEVQIARRGQQRVQALWWPQLQADGMYAHLSERVEVRQPLSYYTDPLKEDVQRIVPGEQLVTGLLDRVGEYTLTFPLLPQDVASVGLMAEWVAFSGGKRIFADRVARRLTDVAEVSSSRIGAAEHVELVERYYGLVLARRSTEVCHQRYEALQRHYADALRMEQVGLIDKATRLATQVAMEEAEREWRHAVSVEQVSQTALKRLLGMADEEGQIVPTSPLFVETELPAEALFVEAMQRNNYTLTTLSLEQQMATDKLRMDIGSYLPEVALFGKQTLWAHGLPSNLMPRTMVGVGFTWNLFDGLDRERKVAQTKLTQQALAWSREEAEAELTVVVTELYATLQRTMADIRVLDSTIALSEELLRMRRTAFAEGMATSTELIDVENSLAASRLARLTAQYACNVAWANLQAVCGASPDPSQGGVTGLFSY